MMKLNIQLFGGRGASSNTNRTLKSILNVVNNGQVFDFSVGPTMTIISRYEKGDYTWLNSSGDSPMRRFEQEVLPKLGNEFVVIDDGIGKISRASRFKKYGYEVVGETSAREKDITNGVYTSKERNYKKDKWILMRKKG